MTQILFQGINADDLVQQIAERVTADDAKAMQRNSPPLLTDREETARLLNVSVSPLDKLVRDGVVPSTSVGKKRLFDPQEAADALKRNGRQSKPAAMVQPPVITSLN